MNKIVLLLSVLLFTASATGAQPCSDLLNFKMNKLRSAQKIDFCETFQGKVILAVNTASNCGFTPQFKGLENLYQKYKDKGLVVIGFPSNDFNQEFDVPEKTANICYINYGVTFPMVEKSIVTGASANNFFHKLIKSSGREPQWNFYKYLISWDGLSVEAFASNVTPEELDSKINGLISTK